MLAAALALVVGMAPPEAPASVQWEAGSACVDEAAFGDALTQRLGSKPEGREWVAVDADVSATESEAGVRARVELRTAHGETTREMEAASCVELIEAVALLVAMHVDPLLDPLAPAPSVEPEPEPAPVALPDPAPIEPPIEPSTDREPTTQPSLAKRSRRPRSPPRGVARLDIGAGAGPLPRLGPALGLAIGVLWLPLRAEVRAHYLTPQRIEPVGGAGALLQLWTIGPRICGEPSAATLQFPLCIGVDVGAMHGGGRGVANADSAARAIVVLPASAGLAVAVTRVVALTAEAEAGAVVLRPEFTVEPIGPIWTTPSWTVRAALGVEVRFP